RPVGPASPNVQQNLDELAKESFKLQLPGEAGRGGMVGRPAVAPAAAEVAPRPPERIDMSMEGRKDLLTNTLQKELEAQDLAMTSSYRGPDDPLSRAYPGSAHTKGLAFDVRAHTEDQADTAISKVRELLDARGLQLGQDYKILDEVRSPSRHATAPHVHVQFTD